MPICKKINAEHRKVCIGDMRWLIDIYNPVIVPPDITNGEIDYTVTKEPETTVWSMVKTFPNLAVFDSMNTETTISHDFYIRFRTDITPEKNIRYPAGTGLYYNIVLVENFENRNEFLRLRCNLKGVENHV